jgi:hypothetical protein
MHRAHIEIERKERERAGVERAVTHFIGRIA